MAMVALGVLALLVFEPSAQWADVVVAFLAGLCLLAAGAEAAWCLYARQPVTVCRLAAGLVVLVGLGGVGLGARGQAAGYLLALAIAGIGLRSLVLLAYGEPKLRQWARGLRGDPTSWKAARVRSDDAEGRPSAKTPVVAVEPGEGRSLVAGPENPAYRFEITASRGLTLAEAHAAIDERPGATAVAERLHRLITRAVYDGERQRLGKRTAEHTLHAAFAGNPGTGKTTSAELYAEALHAAGGLVGGQLVKVTRKDLVAGFVGQSEPRTAAAVEAALGGCLFVDEAYALDKGAEADFGGEVIATLLDAMETHRHELAVVLAGYPDEIDALLDSNPGLRSRVGRRLDFPDYEPPQLLEIARYMLRGADYALDAEADRALAGALDEVYRRRDRRTFGNARAVRGLIDLCVEEHAERLRRQGALGDPLAHAHLGAADIERGLGCYLTEQPSRGD
jgi:hypothetical protein